MDMNKNTRARSEMIGDAFHELDVWRKVLYKMIKDGVAMMHVN